MSTMLVSQPSVLIGVVPLYAVNRVTLTENYERAHLWGPRPGDEAAAGIWLPSESVNIGQQARVEETLEALAQMANQAGRELRFKVTGNSFPWEISWQTSTGTTCFRKSLTSSSKTSLGSRHSTARSRSASAHPLMARPKCSPRRCSNRSDESRIKRSSECPN